jgi:hypothetical protein
MSSSVRRLRSDRPTLSVFSLLVAGSTLHREKRVLQHEMQSTEWATASNAPKTAIGALRRGGTL